MLLRKSDIGVISILALGLIFLLTGSATDLNDSPLRIMTGGIVVSFLPGFLALRFLRLRLDHFLEVLGLSLIGSLFILVVTALVAFFLHLTIGTWAEVLFALNVALFLLILRRRREVASVPLPRLTDGLDVFLLVALGALGVIFFRSADNLLKVDGGETALHFTYIRNYASGLPLDFVNSALRPDLMPSNLFFLFEFLLAGISTVAGVDCVVGGLRSRWLMPIFAIAALYLLVKSVLREKRISKTVTAVVVVGSLLQFWMVEPSAWGGFGFKEGMYRGLTNWMPSLHHADSAMDILLPLHLALLFGFLYRPSRWRLAAFLGFFSVSFFWHPREFFQVMWYVPMAMLAEIIVYRWSVALRRIVKVYLPTAGLLLLVGLAFGALTRLTPENAKESAIRWDHKRKAVELLVSRAGHFRTWFEAQAPFRFTNYDLPTSINDPGQPQLVIWFILAGASLLVWSFTTRRRLRWFAAFVIVTWGLTLCLHQSQLLLLIATYDEILVAKLRFLSPFAHLLVGFGFVTLFSRLPILVSLPTSLALGFGLRAAWLSAVTNADPMPIINAATSCVAIATLLLIIARWTNIGLWLKARSHRPGLKASLAVVGFALFAGPLAWTTMPGFIKNVALTETDVLAPFKPGNYLGVSADMIAFIREKLPPRSEVLREGDQAFFLNVFKPLYLRPLLQTVEQDRKEFDDYAANKHAILKHGEGHEPVLQEVQAYIKEKSVAYIYARQKHNVDYLKRLATEHPEVLTIAFASTENGDVIAQITQRNHVPQRDRVPQGN